jgi:hypothetical protein
MTRPLQILTVIVCAGLCAWVSACAQRAAARPMRSVSAESVGAVLVERWAGLAGRVHLDDVTYDLIDEADVWKAVAVGWRPWRAEVWDCDDQAAGILHALRTLHAGPHAPAAGRLSAQVRGVPHAVVWWISEGSGRLRFLDPSRRELVDGRLIVPMRAFDK